MPISVSALLRHHHLLSNATVFQPSAIELFWSMLPNCGTLCRWTSCRQMTLLQLIQQSDRVFQLLITSCWFKYKACHLARHCITPFGNSWVFIVWCANNSQLLSTGRFDSYYYYYYYYQGYLYSTRSLNAANANELTRYSIVAVGHFVEWSTLILDNLQTGHSADWKFKKIILALGKSLFQQNKWVSISSSLCQPCYMWFVDCLVVRLGLESVLDVHCPCVGFRFVPNSGFRLFDWIRTVLWTIRPNKNTNTNSIGSWAFWRCTCYSDIYNLLKFVWMFVW